MTCEIKRTNKHTHTNTQQDTVYILKSNSTISAGMPGTKYNNTSERYKQTLQYFTFKLLNVDVDFLRYCNTDGVGLGGGGGFSSNCTVPAVVSQTVIHPRIF